MKLNRNSQSSFFVFGHFFSQATLSNQKKQPVFLLQLYVFELIFSFSFSTISFLLC